jgi:hypothetical protein
MSAIDTTLAERGTRYGAFEDQAIISQALLDVMEGTLNWKGLTADQKQALVNIAGKIGRILNGDPNYADSWHDIAGYATLVEQRLLRDQSDMIRAASIAAEAARSAVLPLYAEPATIRHEQARE